MAEIDVTRKPLPTPRPESAPFWAGLAEEKIRLQRCDQCARVQFYPRPGCRYCGATELTWETLSGEAELYTYTIIHRAPFAAFADDVPYVFAVVQLKEGPRLVSWVVDAVHENVHIGMPLTPVFRRVDDSITLLYFRPAE